MPTNRSHPVTVEACWLGEVPYRTAWELQRALVAEVAQGLRPDTLLLLGHPHVFTFGRRGHAEHLLWDEAERERRAVEVVWCDRGGDATYHGPGQLVGYPILDLRRHGGDILAYLRRLEGSLVDYLDTLGLKAKAVGELTGVWSAGGPGAEAAGAALAKVAAIGVKLTGPVTSHGFALNLTTDLDYFAGIVPCGLTDRSPTSVARLGGGRIETETAAAAYAGHFAERFGVQTRWAGPASPNLVDLAFPA